jgi:hypothetical protein
MSLKHHFKFSVLDAKQLSIAFMGAISAWAATGFQRDIPHLIYPIMGFITGGLASHNSMANPNVQPDSHIITPYVANIEDKSLGVPAPSEVNQVYKPEGADVKKVIKINSGIIRNIS